MSLVTALLLAACVAVLVGPLALAPTRRLRRIARRRVPAVARGTRSTPVPLRSLTARAFEVSSGPAVGSAWPLVLAPSVALWSGPAAGLGVLVAALAVRWGLARARHRRSTATRAEAEPELVDLFVLAASAGLPVSAALVAVAPRAPTPLRADVERAARRVRDGVLLAEALAELERDAPPGCAALARALADAARTGAPLVPVLQQVAATSRDERTRAAEEAARRLPVSLLFPLAACILPAAVLLAVVPVLVASLSSLHP